MEYNGHIAILPMNEARETTLSDSSDSICLVSSLEELSEDLTKLSTPSSKVIISGWMGPT